MLPLISAFRQLRRLDARRRGVPGEHWAAFGAGTALLSWAKRSRSPLVKAVAYATAGALVWRAASGRDGVAHRLRARTPSSHR